MSQTVPNWIVEYQRKSQLSSEPEEPDPKDYTDANVPHEFRHIYPEFLPSENVYHSRDRIFHKLERQDMMRRRAVLDIPEFYVGSIMAVTVADPHAPGKTNRFVGICMDRGAPGLRAYFILRNAIDGEGIEIFYHLYNPTIQKIEVLKLEKRLDEKLYYLRDAPIEYSTFPFNMEPVAPQKGALVPVNSLVVPLNPRPWWCRWERQIDMKGFSFDPSYIHPKTHAKKYIEYKPWERYDLMRDYRRTESEAVKEAVYKDVYLQQQDINKRKEEERQKLVQEAKSKARVKRKKRSPVSGAVFDG